MTPSQIPNEEPEPTAEKFYLPATSISTDLSRVEAVVTNLFDLHGRVLIPRTYKR